MAIDEQWLRAERPRLVRQCYRLTGNLDAAEDLAQEVLYEAIRNAHKLHDPSASGPWLFAITRNVCLRWNARRGRDVQMLDETWDRPDEYDLEIELDRKDLGDLLDRALGLLPEESRQVLIERYVRESPHAEIARAFGISVDAAMKRVERGKLRLKSVLSTSLIHDAVSHGLADRLFDDWDVTDLWCPVCGARRLLGRIINGYLWLICKPCRSLPVSHYAALPVPRGVTGYVAIHDAVCAEHHRRFAGGIRGLSSTCRQCGRSEPYRLATDLSDGTHYAARSCFHCGINAWQFVSAFQLLASPRGRAFRGAEERVRLLPERDVDIGVPGLAVGFESLTSGRRLGGVLVRDTLQLVSVD